MAAVLIATASPLSNFWTYGETHGPDYMVPWLGVEHPWATPLYFPSPTCVSQPPPCMPASSFLLPFHNHQHCHALLSTGLYACKGGRNSPCLVYVSFNQKIYIYWDVQLERMESTNLLKILKANPEFEDLLQQLGVGEWCPV